MHSARFFHLIITLLLPTVPLVQGHGYVQNITIDSKVYAAWHPFDDPYATPPPSLIARKVPDDGPGKWLSFNPNRKYLAKQMFLVVTNVDDTSIRCNAGGEAGAPLSAPANGGSSITFAWNRVRPDFNHSPRPSLMLAALHY